MAAATKEKTKEDAGLHVVGGDDEPLVDPEATPEDQAAIDAANAQADAEVKPDDERSIEDMADDPVVEKPTPPTQLAIPGTRDKIPRSTGGRAPEECEIRLMGGRRPIVGSFDKGDKLALIVDSTVRAAEDIDQDDEWGNVQKTIRVLKARQTYVRVITPELLVQRLLAMVPRAEAKNLIDQMGE